MMLKLKSVSNLQQSPRETGDVRKMDVFQGQLAGSGCSWSKKEVVYAVGGAGLVRLYQPAGA